jgi:hypothetical protein
MVRLRRTATRLCRCGTSAPLFSPTRRMHAESGSSFFSSCENPQTFQHSNVPTLPRVIPFRITSFADPHDLTPTESYSYKKEGRGWVPGHFAPTQAQSTCATHSNTRNPNLFIHLLNDSLDTQGVGACLFPPRGSAHSASLRYPSPRFASPPCLKLGGTNESRSRPNQESP